MAGAAAAAALIDRLRAEGHAPLLSPPLLARDASLLARLLYRNKSQHRGSAHYARLVGLNRALKTLAAAGGGGALGKALAGGGAAATRAALHRLLATAAAASAVVAAAGSAASALSAPLARSYFPALATAGLAVAARAAALGSGVALTAAAAFNAAAPLAGLPPPPWAKHDDEAAEETARGLDLDAPLPAVVAVEWVGGGTKRRGRRACALLPVPRVVGKGGRLEVRALVTTVRPAAAQMDGVGVPIDRAAFACGAVVEVEKEKPRPPPPPPRPSSPQPPLAVFDDRGGALPPMPEPEPAPDAPPQPLIGRSKSAAKRAAAKERAERAKAAAAAAGKATGWEGWVGGGGGSGAPRNHQAPPHQQQPARKKGRR